MCSEPLSRNLLENQGCGSVFLFSGSGSGSRGWCWRPIRIPGFNDQKLKKNYSWKFLFIFFWSKTAIYLSLGLRKVCPSYRRSLQFSKEAIQHFKTWTFKKNCLLLWVIFALLDPDPDPDPDSEYGSGFGSTDPIEYGSNTDPDPDPQPCWKLVYNPELRIRDVYMGSRMFIWDTGSEFFPSRIRIKVFKYLTQEIVSKLSEYNPDCSSRCPDPDPGSRGEKAPDPRSTTLVYHLLIPVNFFLSQELGADEAGVGAAAQAERQQRHSLHQAWPRLPPLGQGVRPGLSRQIRPVGERFCLRLLTCLLDV